MSAFVSCCLSSVVCLEGSEAGGGERKEKKKKLNEGCVRNVVGKAAGLTTAARAAALIPLGLLHCSTLSLEDASVVTGENEKSEDVKMFSSPYPWRSGTALWD